MAEIDQVPMFDELPMDNPDALKKDEGPNVLQAQLIYLMERDKKELADIIRGTSIPWTTLYDWYKGAVRAQKADENLLKLARFFNVSINFLVFDEGDDSPFYLQFNNEPAANINQGEKFEPGEPSHSPNSAGGAA